MSRYRGRLALLASVVAGLVAAPSASAHPEVCGKAGGGESASSLTNTLGSFWMHAAPGEECFTDEQIAGLDDSGAQLAAGEVASSDNLRLVNNLPKSGPFAGEAAFNSDLAFWGEYAYQGNYNGVQITDISEKSSPRVVAQINCPGAQNDVSVWKGLLFASVDSSRDSPDCVKPDGTPNAFQTATKKESWEGIRIFDVADPTKSKQIGAVETDCGSHTHTLIPDEANNRVLLYVSSYSPNAAFPDCQPPHDKISIVEVPLDDPKAAKVIDEPVLFPDGGLKPRTQGCHDITVYPAQSLAAGACMGQGTMLDIADPAKPKVLSNVTDDNFDFWHSATISHDGKSVLFTDELGGGGGPTCNPTVGPKKGADAIFDISDRAKTPVLKSYFKIPRTQSNTENCVAHNGNLLPVAGKSIFVQAWYQGGISILDWTDPANPKELAWFDRGPLSDAKLILGGSWSAYWYNNRVFSNDIQKGLDVLQFTGADKASAAKLPYLNAQTQETPRN